MNSWAKLGLFAAGLAVGAVAVKLLDSEKGKELREKAVEKVKETAGQVKAKFTKSDDGATIIIDDDFDDEVISLDD
ncbi:MAG: hypothetical protein E7562_03180 [Ruminococcaceae bacterium]|nr:hypothetical protein [Oscillospiraceae bacterium]